MSSQRVTSVKKPVASKKVVTPNTTSSTATANASNVSTSNAASTSPIMKLVRSVRTFQPRVFLHKHVFGVYWSAISFAFVYANFRQWQRMKKLYPDYNEVAKSTGTQFTSMKEQELQDVQAFNAKAEMMRVDLKARMGGSAI
jgi:hypothetical protein